MFYIPNEVEAPAVDPKLETVRKYQRHLLQALLVYLLLVVAMFLVPASAVVFIQIFGLCALLVMVMCVGNIAVKVYSSFTGVMMALLMFIPLLNLLVLAAVNERATKLLRENGYRVGVLGAKV